MPFADPHAAPDSAPGLNRRILSLALPALGALVAEPLFVLIDSAMVGHLGTTSLAGLSLASTILTTTVGLFVFLAYSTTATTARLFGAGRHRQGLSAGVDGVWLALLLGLGAAAVLGAGAPWIVAAMGAEGEVARAAVAYLWASAPGLPGMLVVFAATGVLRGLLDTRTPFVVACGGAVLNTALNAFLLYGLDLGIAGSGAGTATAQTLMAVALVAPVVRAAHAEGLGLRPHRAGLGGSLREGLPLLVRTLSLRAAIVATVWAATALGPASLAAHQVAFTLWSFAAFALDALAVAAQALIGTALGQYDAEQASTGPGDAGMTGTGRTDAESGDAGRMGAEQAQQSEPGGRTAPDHPAASPGADVPGADSPGGLGTAPIDAVLRRTLAWGVGTGAVIGLVLAAASPWLPWVFTSDASVRGLAVPVLLIMASAMPLAGAVYLFDGVLMGAGDGRYLARA
ncbi:MATE family efflux transporter, partial [Actinomyces bowdenii]